VYELYGLSNNPNPDIDVYSVFHCDSADLRALSAVKHLMAEIKLRRDVTPLNKAVTRQMRQRRLFILTATWTLGSRSIKIISNSYRKNLVIEGRNGQGNLDYAIECRSTGRILGVIEVKKEDFMKGFAQASVQMESTLSRKCKAEEVDNEQEVDKVFGIVRMVFYGMLVR
jgi:hypothetical protein